MTKQFDDFSDQSAGLVGEVQTASFPCCLDPIEDAKLRERAKPLRELSAEVVLSDDAHPAYPAVCDVCGSVVLTLSHCGRPLCIPCQRKRASRSHPVVQDAVLDALDYLDEYNKAHNTRYRMRFVTLTLKNVPQGSLADAVDRCKHAYQCLRRRSFWNERVLGDIPRIEFTFNSSTDSWHVHIHTIVVSAYLPAGPDVARPGESNLRDEWYDLTGDSMIIDVRVVSDPKDAAKELVKYIFSPIDETGKTIAQWPESAREEAAVVLAGPYRHGWYCRIHRSRKRAKCVERESIVHVGFKRRRCEGRYRLERQGFRPLLPSGIMRKLMRHAKVSRDRPSKCPRCGLGSARGKAYWSERSRESLGRDSWASMALNLIQTHEMTIVSDSRRLNLRESCPAGWVPPPPYEDFRPEIRYFVVELLRTCPRGLDDIIELLGAEDSRDIHAVELAVESLRNLGLVFGSNGLLYLNDSMLERLTREDDAV